MHIMPTSTNKTQIVDEEFNGPKIKFQTNADLPAMLGTNRPAKGPSKLKPIEHAVARLVSARLTRYKLTGEKSIRCTSNNDLSDCHVIGFNI